MIDVSYGYYSVRVVNGLPSSRKRNLTQSINLVTEDNNNFWSDDLQAYLNDQSMLELAGI